MNKKIIDYFLIFGSDTYNDKYWERDYVYLIQIILGIIFLPLFAVGLIIKKLFFIKIK